MPWSIRRSGSNNCATRLRGASVVDNNHLAAYAAGPLLSTSRVRTGSLIDVAQMMPRVCPTASARKSRCRPSGRNHGPTWEASFASSSSVVTGVGVPPVSETWSNPPAPCAKTITPCEPQVPPPNMVPGTSQSRRGAVPSSAMR